MTDAVSAKSASTSPMAPFGHRAFTILWIATVLSNIGTWMHDVGAGWLMTELAPSPLMVASVQAATTMPIFLFALLAGAIADIVDRRMLLIWVNAAMGIAAASMAVLVHVEWITPVILLFFTFIFGTGAAFIAPAWQAIVPRLVPRPELSAAIALNSMGINVSRAIGPALAGFLIVVAGLASPFIVNAISVLGIIAAIWWWRADPAEQTHIPREHVGGAMVAGVRYAMNSRPLQATLLRALGFFAFASAFWAMLPLVARQVLDGGPTLYGILLAAVGAGAVLGAFILPKIKARLGADLTVAFGTIGTALVLVSLALIAIQPIAVMAAALAGFSWIAVLTSLNVSAQTSLPDWVRARGLSIFLTVFFGSMSLGSLFWGQVASIWGISTALVAAAIGAVCVLPLLRLARLGQGEGVDLSPSMHWPAPVLSEDLERDGPVMVLIEYRVETVRQAQFVALMRKLSLSRKRGGGYRWNVMQDASEKTRFVESWIEASWEQHLRHHERVSGADKALQDEIRDLQIDARAPLVSHLLSPEKTSKRKG